MDRLDMSISTLSFSVRDLRVQMKEGTVHGYARRDVGVYWMRKLDTPSLSARDLLSKASWRAEFEAGTEEVSVLAQSVIVFRGTLTPPATGAKLIKA